MSEQLTLDLRAALTPVGFRRRDLRGLTYDQLRETVLSFVAVSSQMRFAVGDLLNFCEREHGETLSQLEADTLLSRHTLHNYAWVAGSVAYSRRREALRWSHHEAVASLDPADQTRWLRKAETERLSVDELRSLIRDERDETPDEGDDASPRQTLSEVARRVWMKSQRDGDVYRTPVEDMLALARAIGAAE